MARAPANPESVSAPGRAGMSGAAGRPASRFWSWLDALVPPARKADLQFVLRSRVLILAAWLSALLAVVPLLSRIRTGASLPWITAAAAVWLALVLSPILLRATGSLQLAGGLFLLALALGMPALGYFAGFFPAPVLTWFAVLPLAAALFVDWRMGLAAVGAGLAGIAFLFAVAPGPAAVGVDPGAGAWRTTFLVSACGVVVLVGLLAWAFELIVRRGFDRATALAGRLQKTNVELEAARRDAEAASREKSRFLASMSHELRTPLNGIIGYSELLMEVMEERDDREMVEDLGKVRAAGRHLLHLVNDLLDIAKIEAGRLELSAEPVAVDRLIEEVVSITRPQAEANRNRLDASVAPGLPTIAADRLRLRQVLLNLVSNACKFTEDGEVALAVDAPSDDGDRWVRFRVSDTGIGIPAERLELIFEPFRQADESTTRRHGGTGLGLSLSRQLVESMGGEVSVESTVGSGTTFSVLLPADRPVVEAGG